MTEFCTKCGTPGEGSFCASCGHPRDAALAPLAHTAQAERVAVMRSALDRAAQKHGVPALLSFFIPGLGQMIKGQFLGGIAIFVAMAFSIALWAFVIGIPITGVLWIWQLYDAYTAPDSATQAELKRVSQRPPG
jgi:TM2 domain-containing membrane protein YozV